MALSGVRKDGSRTWRVATSVAFGSAATGVFRALDQLLPGLRGALWRPAEAFNVLLGGLFGWSDSAVRQSPLGTWCQEALLFLAVMISLLWITRRQTIESARMLGAIAMMVAPWLTNGEAIVIALATREPATRGAISAAMTASIGAGLVSWALARKGWTMIAALILACGLLVMLLSIYWLNSPAGALFQGAAIAASAVLFWRTVASARGPWAPALS